MITLKNNTQQGCNVVFRTVITLAVLASGLVADYSDTRRIVVASFNSKEASLSVSKNLQTLLDVESKRYGFTSHVELQNDYNVVILSPFDKKEVVKDVLAKILSEFPSAYIKKIPSALPPTIKAPSVITVKELPKATQKTLFVKDAYTLHDLAVDVVSKDPDVEYRRYEYQGVMEEITIAQAEYRPTLDVSAEAGKTWEKDEDGKVDYTGRQAGVTLRQNLFNGFGSEAKEAREKARAKAAFYKYKEVAQDKVYRAVDAYLKLLKYQQVLDIAEQNVITHEQTLQKVTKKYEEGFTTRSQVERVQGRLALAQSNFVSETNNYYDAKYNLHKAIGKMINANALSEPVFKGVLPKTMDEALDKAIKNNPSILVADHDIEAARQAFKYAKKNFYPTLDFEASHTWYDNKDGETGEEEETNLRVIAQWNLYNGGADEANRYKELNNIHKEIRLKNSLKRQTIEGLELSWSANEMVKAQLNEQIKYRDFTERTLKAYEEEFELGRRTLLDLLDAQDELNNIRIQVLYSHYDQLFAKYRLLDAMGELLNYFNIDLTQEYVREEEPIQKIDSDFDGIQDVHDICDNSNYLETTLAGCESKNEIKLKDITFKKINTEKSSLTDAEVKTLWGK